MSEYGAILTMSSQSNRTAPRQILLFASQWTMALGSFVRTYMSDPIVAIAFPLEAAVYARVRQVGGIFQTLSLSPSLSLSVSLYPLFICLGITVQKPTYDSLKLISIVVGKKIVKIHSDRAYLFQHGILSSNRRSFSVF